MVSQKSLALLLLIFFSFLSAEESFQAKIYRKDSNKQDLLFTHYNERYEQADTLELKHYYVKPDGDISAIDKAILINGNFVRGESSFFDVNEKGEVFLTEDTLKMQFTKDETYKEKVIDFQGNLLLGPLFNDYITENWSQIMNNEKVFFHLPAPNLLKVARFYVRRDDTNPYTGENRTVVRMTVNSLFLKLFINSTYFVYQTNNKRLLEIHGTTILRTKDENGKWEDTTEVEIYYEY